MRYCCECKHWSYEASSLGSAIGYCLKDGQSYFDNNTACEEERLRSAVEDIEQEKK